MNVLVFEDEPSVATLIEKSLREYGHTTELVATAREGLARVNQRSYDVIILDIMLPDRLGWDVCREIRSVDVQTPILILTALNTLEHIVQGLEMGADDYLAKPFRIRELVARLHALQRRNNLPSSTPTETLEFDDLVVNVQEQTVARAGDPIRLTSKEFAMLVYFMQHPKRVLSRHAILENVWGIHFDLETNVVDVFVSYLRNKIDKPYEKKLIHTVFGTGYVLKKDEE